MINYFSEKDPESNTGISDRPGIRSEVTPAESLYQCLVYRTTIKTRDDVQSISKVLDNLPGILDWHVDLDDWENVLRIECRNVTSSDIIGLLRANGFEAEEMPV
jgi:hypothetical protein